MNVLVLLLVAAAVFVVAGRFYSRFIAKSLGEEADHPTPAVTRNDGRDYVPTKRFVVFAHHFSAFASDKPLSPKMIVFNMEKALLAGDRALVAKKRDDLPELVPASFTEGEI